MFEGGRQIRDWVYVRDVVQAIVELVRGTPATPQPKVLKVVDGQQRLKTLLYFYAGIFADAQREFVLRGVESQFAGESV